MSTFGPNTCKAFIPEPYTHRAEIPPDDGKEIVFQWHWPRGTFDKRMSALEIAAFVLPHMPSVLPFLSGYPRVYQEFQLMLQRLILWPKEELDRLASWIKPVVKTQDDDLIEMCIVGVAPPPPGPTHFLLGRKS